jgi:hypothetical protein
MISDNSCQTHANGKGYNVPQILKSFAYPSLLLRHSIQISSVCPHPGVSLNSHSSTSIASASSLDGCDYGVVESKNCDLLEGVWARKLEVWSDLLEKNTRKKLPRQTFIVLVANSLFLGGSDSPPCPWTKGNALPKLETLARSDYRCDRRKGPGVVYCCHARSSAVLCSLMGKPVSGSLIEL